LLALTYLGHQYSLAKIPDTELYWLVTPRRTFSSMPRGDYEKYKNFKGYVPYYEKGKHDVAILHLDQQCLEPQLWERGKGSLFRELNKVITDIPKIVIMHGTPYYPEMFGSDITEENYSKLGFTKDQVGMSAELINLFKEAVKDCDKIIFNSHTAQKQWGFHDDPRAKTIIHGLEEKDWWDLPKEPRVVTMISPAGLDKYYDRTFLRAVKEELETRGIYHCHITVDVRFSNWDEYRKFLGSSLIYFNPTLESPMPRARTEAMLSGCCVITTLNQDSETFIKDGVNGYRAIRNPKYIADLCEGLINNYNKAIEIGQEGRKTALKLFNHERYMNEWREVLDELTK
jgi:glycosyltransferase involved in cell wall biosynthesis